MREEKKPHRRVFGISIGIPAYSRCSELTELLESIFAQTILPAEVTVCEDKSPEREAIRRVVAVWQVRFAAEGCTLNYEENAENLGYDGNVRKVIAISHCRWVMLMGNDDLLLEGCIETASLFLEVNEQLKMVSRCFIRFEQDIHKPVGVSSLSHTNQVFRFPTSSSKFIFRSCGFVGGLIVNREWASKVATDVYDGTLYYQIYLASVSFCEGGIGYIAEPIVGGRAGNPPLFGAASSEKDTHLPGLYTPKGRAKMWSSVLQIVSDVGKRYRMDLRTEIKSELEVRQSFHVFEMMVGSDRMTLSALRDELRSLGLFSHPIPRTLYMIDWFLGSKARVFYRIVRKLLQ